jgi:hypothetical protein
MASSVAFGGRSPGGAPCRLDTGRLRATWRTAVERANATIKDPATNDVARGWCRVKGLAPLTLFLACVLVVRNQRVLDAFYERQIDDARRVERGLAPKSRRRRRRTLADLVGAANAPP